MVRLALCANCSSRQLYIPTCINMIIRTFIYLHFPYPLQDDSCMHNKQPYLLMQIGNAIMQNGNAIIYITSNCQQPECVYACRNGCIICQLINLSRCCPHIDHVCTQQQYTTIHNYTQLYTTTHIDSLHNTYTTTIICAVYVIAQSHIYIHSASTHNGDWQVSSIP